MTPAPHFARVDSFVGNRRDPDLVCSRPCPLCGGAESRSFDELEEFQFFSDSAELPKRAPVRQVRCELCGTLFMDPAYSRRGFELLFAEAGHSFGAGSARYRARADWLLEAAEPRPGERVLDLGCHEGELLSLLPDDLVRVGADADAGALERGRGRFEGVSLVEVDLSRPVALAGWDAPDVLALFHVLEHLPDPLSLLACLREVAGPKTRLVVEVPVLEAAVPEDVVGFFTIHHLTHFTHSSLLAALTAGGWAAERVDASDANGTRVLASPSRDLSPTLPGASRSDLELLKRYQRGYAAAVAEVQRRLPPDPSQPLILWGAGNHTEMLYQRCGALRDPRRALALVDSDAAKWGRSWRGVPIRSPECLGEASWEEAWLVPSSYRGTPAIAAAAAELGVPAERILRLYDPAP